MRTEVPPGWRKLAVLAPKDLPRLRQFIWGQSDATHEECRTHLDASSSLVTISLAHSPMGLPRNDKVPLAVGECGANTAMTRLYSRAPTWQRVYTDTPGHWDSITLTCGMRLSGAMAGLAFPGATNTGTFETYVEEVLVPELRPGDVVIWDNLKPHKSEEAIEAVEDAGRWCRCRRTARTIRRSR